MTKVGVDDYIQATAATIQDLEALPRVDVWPRLDRQALQGLAGEFVDVIDPYTEADPVAVLAHLLTAFGNVIGDEPHARVHHDRHPARLNPAIVGRTALARKGTAASIVRHAFAEVDRGWAALCVKSGLSSGEGLIYHVRDSREETKPVRRNGQTTYERVMTDGGVTDKRLLIIEPEFAVVLKRMAGEGNSLSGVIRQAWDSGNLSTLTKNAPLTATSAHVSVIAHITEEELQRYLSETERANGFGNRFLWFLVRRSKTLPAGDPIPDRRFEPLILKLRAATRFARNVTTVVRSSKAEQLWTDIYPDLSEGEPGLIGAILSRAEAQVLRLSVAYALLDSSNMILVQHLEAALALWKYAATSARRIFGDRLGAPLADIILSALRTRGSLAETDVWSLVGRHHRAGELHAALEFLETSGRATKMRKSTGGRPSVIWSAR